MTRPDFWIFCLSNVTTERGWPTADFFKNHVFKNLIFKKFFVKNPPNFLLKNQNFVKKIKILWKNQNFVKKSKFRPKIKISSKNQNFVKKSRFRQKIKISSKNRNFVKKIKISSKNQNFDLKFDFLRKNLGLRYRMVILSIMFLHIVTTILEIIIHNKSDTFSPKI